MSFWSLTGTMMIVAAHFFWLPVVALVLFVVAWHYRHRIGHRLHGHRY